MVFNFDFLVFGEGYFSTLSPLIKIKNNKNYSIIIDRRKKKYCRKICMVKINFKKNMNCKGS